MCRLIALQSIDNLPPPRGRVWERGKTTVTQFLLSQSRNLRSESTPHEQKLWYHLRANRFENLKFRRQCVVGSYIVDFYCPERKLIIELDGGHDEIPQRVIDGARDRYFFENGYQVLRFWNNEIDSNLNGVLEKLRETVHTPSP